MRVINALKALSRVAIPIRVVLETLYKVWSQNFGYREESCRSVSNVNCAAKDHSFWLRNRLHQVLLNRTHGVVIVQFVGWLKNLLWLVNNGYLEVLLFESLKHFLSDIEGYYDDLAV